MALLSMYVQFRSPQEREVFERVARWRPPVAETDLRRAITAAAGGNELNRRQVANGIRYCAQALAEYQESIADPVIQRQLPEWIREWETWAIPDHVRARTVLAVALHHMDEYELDVSGGLEVPG